MSKWLVAVLAAVGGIAIAIPVIHLYEDHVLLHRLDQQVAQTFGAIMVAPDGVLHYQTAPPRAAEAMTATSTSQPVSTTTMPSRK